jgi:hypothetical protein
MEQGKRGRNGNKNTKSLLLRYLRDAAATDNTSESSMEEDGGAKTSTKNATSKAIPEEPISNDPFHEALEKLPTFNGERTRVQQRGTTTTTTTVNCEEEEQQQPCRIPRERNSSNGGEEIETDRQIKSDRGRGRRKDPELEHFRILTSDFNQKRACRTRKVDNACEATTLQNC